MLTGLARWVGFLTMTVLVVGALLLSFGFIWFVWQISDEEVRLERNADGIIVLTGAATRIPDALELLTTQHGKRLLITGVHPTTSAREIARLTALNPRIFAESVDLDRSALNTLGNAIEAKRWARERGFTSLIVVTSNWHMPRAMAELSHQMPDATLIPYPVVSDKIKSEPWWSSGATVRLLLGEYLKYVFAMLRMGLEPDIG